MIALTTQDEYLAAGLAAADGEGLETTSWRTGDPTRTLFVALAEALATKDQRLAEFVRGGILSLAEGDWLDILSAEVYGVDPVQATSATPTLSLMNNGGGYYVIDAGDLTAKCSVTGKTYHNTSGPHSLAGLGTTATLTMVADEPGTASSVGTDEIDALVTTFLGLAITGSTASNGTDKQGEASIKDQCLATLGALSPNGPPDAYEYVCCNSALTGNTEITRAKSYGDSDTGDTIVYVAGPAGAVSGPALAAAEAACEQWATPLCITLYVVNATAAPQIVAATVGGTGLPSDYVSLAQAVVAGIISAAPIGGLLSRSAYIAALHALAAGAGAQNVTVDLTSPATDVQLASSAMAIVGSVTIG
jgi:hypothetical protein